MNNMEQKEINIVGIITKRHCEPYKDVILKLEKYLKRKEKEILYDSNCSKFFKGAKGLSKSELLPKADLVIVLGGDGTLLKTARRTCRQKTLVLGVNMGTLGFLTECTPDKLFECLGKIFEGNYYIDKRSLLRVTIYRKKKKLDTFLALNDAVINQGSFARLIQMNIEINNRKVVNFLADGVIIATPTGSTAHSLSAGGAIVHPMVEGFIVTPICARSLSIRPIVLPNSRQLTITIPAQSREASEVIGLTLDGQDTLTLKYGDQIKCRKSKRPLYLVRTKHSYYKMLRTKLNWGER